MKIGVYQFAPVFGEVEQNVSKIEEAVRLTDAALLVAPELCTTGYQFISEDEVRKLSESVPDGPTVQRLSGLCAERKIHLVFGMAESENEMCYNTSVLLGPKGFIGKYRKVHLFWDEFLWFQPGNLGFPVWDLGNIKVGMMICYDWIYPEAARSLALAGADVICHPVNLVLPFCQDAMVTRSIENRVFTVTANRFGTEARGDKSPLTFTGGSQIVDPNGQVLFRLGTLVESLQEIGVDPEKARDKQITPGNHLWKDLRTEQYKERL